MALGGGGTAVAFDDGDGLGGGRSGGDDGGGDDESIHSLVHSFYMQLF